MSTVDVSERGKRYVLSPAESAHALSVCQRTIYNLISRGELKCVKIAGTTRIPITEIERITGVTGSDAA